MFDEPDKLILGLITGVIFGFLLQKGRVAKFQVILGQLLFRDCTVVKIMGTAVAVGTVGVNLLVWAGAASLHIQTASVARILVGGVLFGMGLAIFGLCPGTSVAACGEGHKDAMVGVLGMLLGAGAYVAAFPRLRHFFESFPDLGKVTLPQVTDIPTAAWVAGVAIVLGVVEVMLGRRPEKTDASR